MNTKIYKVGGAVRDELLGLQAKDVDYAVEAPSWGAMRDLVLARGAKIFIEKPEYFTIRAKDPQLGSVDFTLCRKDGEYTDGRHPDSVEVGTIFEDLARRDFTVNAMAKDIETGIILDPHDGKKDLKDLMLRFVGEPEKRLQEDKLRAFRALRFKVTKNLIIEHQSSLALHNLVPSDFKAVSTERIREELVRMFQKDSAFSFHLLFNEYPHLGLLVQLRNIWFKPTTESK